MKNEIFEQNPKLEKCFGTSDGEFFYSEDDAKNHSKSLEERSVETIYNENFLEVVDSEDLSDDALKMAEFEADKAAAALAEKEAAALAEKEAAELAEKEAAALAQKAAVKTVVKKVTSKTVK